MNITIRRATSADIATLLPLVQAYWHFEAIEGFDPDRVGAASGIGRRLLQAAEVEFTARGCTNVSLQLARGNDAGRAFYRQEGYAPRAGFELLGKALGPPRS
jgi:GNAT superfamily N-acetyltransferase